MNLNEHSISNSIFIKDDISSVKILDIGEDNDHKNDNINENQDFTTKKPQTNLFSSKV